MGALDASDSAATRRRRPACALRLAAACLTLGGASPAFAGTDVAVVLTTNYLTNGYSRSADLPSAQVNLDHQQGNAYIGVWASKVDFDEPRRRGAQLEIGPYAGYSFRLDDRWRGEVLASAYLYDGEIGGRAAHYWEGYAMLHYEDVATLQLSATPNAYGTGKPSEQLELSARYPVRADMEVTATAAYTRSRHFVGYDRANWQLGLVWRRAWGNLALQYYGSHEFDTVRPDAWDHHPHEYTRRLVASITLGAELWD